METKVDFEIKTRHYEKVSQLVPRHSSDNINGMSLTADVLDKAQAVRPTDPRLIDTTDGAIKKMLLAIPHYAVYEEPLAEVYVDLLHKLPPDIELTVLTHENTEALVRRLLRMANKDKLATVVAAPDHIHFSIWAEDAYAIVHDNQENKKYFVEPYSFLRYADGLIADFIMNATGMRTSKSPLYFQGGNMLIGDNFFLIGADYPRNSLEYIGKSIISQPGIDKEQQIHNLYRDYLDHNRKLFYVGSSIPVPQQQSRMIEIGGEEYEEILYFGNKPGTVQPLFHIDMFISLAGRDSDGRYRVLVGSPKLAADILGIRVWPHAMNEIFDNIAMQMSSLGFKVIRNPLPLVYMDDAYDPDEPDQPKRKQRIWYFATSNNALVQNSKARGNVVWLPTYGHGNWEILKATDEMNKRIWESLDYKVIQLGDFHPFAENLGAVHCIKKYIERV